VAIVPTVVHVPLACPPLAPRVGEHHSSRLAASYLRKYLSFKKPKTCEKQTSHLGESVVRGRG